VDGQGQPLDGPAVHDVCAVAQVAVPGLLTCVPAQVRWRRRAVTAGMTVTDFAAPAADWNAQVAMAIDTGAFWTWSWTLTAGWRRPARAEPARSVGSGA